MSVMKYKDPNTGEVKKLFAPVIDSYTKNEVYNKEETNNLLSNKADLDENGKVPNSQLPDMDYAPSTHNQSASTITAGTFLSTGVKAATGTDYTTDRIRNIQASTTDLTASSSSLTNGNIYMVYQ